MRVPKRWGTEPQIRGVARQIEHINYGTRDAEWLNITFMEKADATSDMTNWVETYIAMSGFPMMLKLDPTPSLTSWT